MTTPLPSTKQPPPKIYTPNLKVIGLGGGGCNAIDRMLQLGLRGVHFIAANTDKQALEGGLAPTKIQLGPRVTRGLGAGGKPQIGQAAAEESYQELRAALYNTDMVFLTAGMGGGTGTGAIPVAAQIAREQGAVTIAIVTTPFAFEMGHRQRNAMEGLRKLRPHTDTLITIPNDRLLTEEQAARLPIETAFHYADDILRQGVQAVTELITEPGIINVDFAHLRRMMKMGGGALMAIGMGRGTDKALRAVEQALTHPLLDSIALEEATGIIANFSGGPELTLFEIADAIAYLQAQSVPTTDLVMGLTHDERLEDRVQVILIITGLGAPSLEETMQGVEKFPNLVPTHNTRENIPAGPQPALVSSPYDLPAFMRRKARYINNLTFNPHNSNG
ncbi:MAG: cell division protein FtsZ [Chloroflexota bacterium]